MCYYSYKTQSNTLDHVRAGGRDFVLKEQAIDKRFIRDCERMDRLRHPCIVPVEGLFFTERTKACLIMPYYQRGNLR